MSCATLLGEVNGNNLFNKVAEKVLGSKKDLKNFFK